MRVETPAGDVIELGMVGAAPTVGIEDFSRRVTDDFGVTTVVRRGFRRRMSVQVAVATDQVDQLQRQLADLRATPALWIADDRFASLSVRGFYKDFSIDIPGEAISSCTLTIEGLALTDAGVDTGGDPAPDGATSTLRMIQPVKIGDAQLIDSNVPENDYQEWSAGVTYDAGARVMRAAAHRVYESAIGGNVGNDPAGQSGKWLDVGPTNRWAMFDQALGTSTSNPGSVYALIDITGVDTIALLDLVAGAVRVIATGYDRTVPVDTGAVTFFDLPARGRATVIVGADGQASVGTLLAGRLVSLGLTEANPSAGITDYSRKVVDDFGAVTIIQRAWAKKMAVRALISTSALDLVATRIAAVRATPALWIGQAGVDALTTYGFFKDYSVEVGENVSKLSLTIEGLSKAAPLLDPNAALNAVRDRLDQLQADVDALASDGVITAGREKAKLQLDYATLTGSFDAIEARYQALGQPADVADARGAAIGARDALRQLLDTYQPAWTDIEVDTPISAGAFRDRWAAASRAISAYAAAITGRPGRDGRDGNDGLPGAPGSDGRTSYTHFAYANSADGVLEFTTGAPQGRRFLGRFTDFNPLDSQRPADYTWSEYVGPRDFGLAPSGDVVVGTTYAFKFGNSQEWNAQLVGTEGFRGGIQLSFRIGSTGCSFMAGLNEDPFSNWSWDTLNHAFYVEGGGQLYIAESGNPTAQHVGAWQQGDLLIVRYDNRRVQYFQNGTRVRSVDVAADQLLFVDSSFFHPGARMDAISYSPASAAGADGRDGTDGSDGLNGEDGRNGVDGKTASFHFAWSNSLDGRVDFTTGAQDGRIYQGVYVDYDAGGDSGDPARYTWSRYVGQPGKDGSNGIDGADGTKIHKAYANSPDGHVDFSVTDYDGRKFLGLRIDYQLADSTNPDDYAWSLIQGKDGTSPITLDQNISAMYASADYLGNVDQGQFPRTSKFTMREGVTDVSAATTWSIASVNSSAMIDTSGLLSVTGATNDGYVDVTGTYKGSVQTRRVTITLNRAAAPPQTPTQQTIQLAPNAPFNTTFTQVGSLSITADANGIIRCLAGASIRVNIPNENNRVVYYRSEVKLAYRRAGTQDGFSDFQGGTVPVDEAWARGYPEPDQSDTDMGIAQTQGTGAANELIEVVLYMRRISGAGTAKLFNGFLTGQTGQ
jgi:hypothetical protein